MRLLILLILLIPGLCFSLIQPFDEINITADNMSLDQNKEIATFSNNVIVKSNDTVIVADKMIAHYNNKNNKISSINLFGNIIITNKNQIAKGQEGIYDLVSKKIKLEKNVILINDNNMLKGAYLIYDLESKHAYLSSDSKGQVKAIFSSKK